MFARGLVGVVNARAAAPVNLVPDEKLQLIRRLHGEGKSRAVIAAEADVKLTRIYDWTTQGRRIIAAGDVDEADVRVQLARLFDAPTAAAKKRIKKAS